MKAAALALVLVLSSTIASAAPPPPTGAHPRMLLDPDLRAAWKKQAGEDHNPVRGAIAICDSARTTHEQDHAEYQGEHWAEVLQACLVAWAATDSADHAATAIRFFTALIDDLDVVGDGKGGDLAARRDSGYAIRNLGPYTALAYDWLHDAPGMTEELRARARSRWAAWMSWYADKGYNAHIPASNYQAGYLLAATAIAIAEAGEAGDAGNALWTSVADVLWGKDMASVLAPGGLLDGGDWGEGWQYAPLAVAEYALAARIAHRAGIQIEGIAPWLAGVLKRHVYALAPSDRGFVGGDVDNDAPNIPTNVLTLSAVALGESSPDDKRWARGELSRLKLSDHHSPLYTALAGVGDAPVLPPRASWPLWYLAVGTGTLYARTRWDEHAVWTVMHCVRAYETDHHHSDAGNFVLSRGADDLVVDPSPYGSLSTLTGNAPTVESVHFPANYHPGQGWWGTDTAWAWTKRTTSGVIAARCDYADQYRFGDAKSDIAMASRDLVLLPSADGQDASMVVVDRATTAGAERAMYLQFRTPGPLALAGTIAQAVIGGSKLVIADVAASGGTPALGKPNGKDCDSNGNTRGNCRAARFAVNDYRLQIPGPEPRAVHVVSAIGAGASAAATPLTGPGWAGVHVTGPRDAVVVWPTSPGDDAPATLAYTAPHGASVTHVILGGPSGAVTAKLAGADCAVEVAAGTGRASSDPGPQIVTLDDHCAVAADPPSNDATAATGARIHAAAHGPRSRSGCCGAQAAPTSPIVMTFVVLGWWLVRRRGRRTAA